AVAIMPVIPGEAMDFDRIAARTGAALFALALAGCKLATLQENAEAAALEGAIVGRVAHQEADYSRLVAFELEEAGGGLVARNYTSFATPRGFIIRGAGGPRSRVGGLGHP